MMDVALKDNYPQPDVVFLYKIVKGHASHSFGTYCAFVAGVPEELLERANEVAIKLTRNEPLEPITSNQARIVPSRLIKVVCLCLYVPLCYKWGTLMRPREKKAFCFRKRWLVVLRCDSSLFEQHGEEISAESDS
eukprot:TRINITY_DN2591_c0_g1_i1.p1 TRINITY_DN2591_c0_g1~~TRINITY_DN2591_c0_g1_i1.p1  ORF type:complete len:135 (+),score=12.09 TRINITY_DN2591_c0_g1_i1:2-406(+)